MQLLFELGTGFVQGFFAIGGNACLLPLYPGLIAFLANQTPNQRRAGWFGVLVLAGVMTLLLAFGVGVALAKIALHDVLMWVLPLVYLIVIGMGVLLLIGYNPFMRLPMLQSPRFKNPYVSAYVYGLLLGPMTLPCAGHYLVAALSFSTKFENAAFSIAYYAFFALGFGVPLLILPLLAQPLQRRLMGWLTTNTRALQRASGVLLIAMGVFGIWTELLVESNPKWELGYNAYGVYWLVAAIAALAVGWWSRTPQNLQS